MTRRSSMRPAAASRLSPVAREPVWQAAIRVALRERGDARPKFWAGLETVTLARQRSALLLRATSFPATPWLASGSRLAPVNEMLNGNDAAGPRRLETSSARVLDRRRWPSVPLPAVRCLNSVRGIGHAPILGGMKPMLRRIGG